MAELKRVMLVFFVIGLFLLSGCTRTEKASDSPHSEDWQAIEELLYNQCKARIREKWELLGSLYSFNEDTFEYKDLKRVSKLAFRTVSILGCEYTIKKIEFKDDNTAYVTADLYLKEVQRTNLRNKKEVTVSLPPEDDPNFLKLIKLDGEWKFCPAEDCFGIHSDKYSCPDGTMVDSKKECPVLDIEYYAGKPLSECIDNRTEIENLLPKNIGPFFMNPASIQTSENDTKLYRASEHKIGKLDIVKGYSADYQKIGNNRRMFSLAYIELGDELDFRRYVNETHGILAELLGKYNSSREVDAEFGGTIANIAYFPTAKQEDKAFTITKRGYVYIPEKHAIIRFLFNDWLTEDDVPMIMSTYFNNLCGA